MGLPKLPRPMQCQQTRINGPHDPYLNRTALSRRCDKVV
jgi:hypothetical protein